MHTAIELKDLKSCQKSTYQENFRQLPLTFPQVKMKHFETAAVMITDFEN